MPFKEECTLQFATLWIASFFFFYCYIGCSFNYIISLADEGTFYSLFIQRTKFYMEERIIFMIPHQMPFISPIFR